MPNIIGISHATILMEDVFEKFPLLTTKKMFWKGIVHELLWFLHGKTNIKYLVDNNVNIWNGDAYRWYQKHCEMASLDCKTMEGFIEGVKKGEHFTVPDPESSHPYDKYKEYTLGDLGKVYGYQWRNQNGVDQIKDIFEDLTKNPYGRYKILDAWNKKEFPEMALPPCHLLYQFIVRPMTAIEREDYYRKVENIPDDEGTFPNASDDNVHEILNEWKFPKYYLDLNMYQRSCDTFLGVPFNLASMSLFLLIMAKAVGMVAGEAFWIGGDTHLYLDHLPKVVEQLSRKPMKLPTMKINKEINSFEDIMKLTINDFELVNYESHDRIQAELFTGLKKN